LQRINDKRSAEEPSFYISYMQRSFTLSRLLHAQ